ncbi:MAG: hypothetical protein H7328_09660 [Bdellovibrio sp.]|nr:hypothetical protein [Bdellovibrio sp.]
MDKSKQQKNYKSGRQMGMTGFESTGSEVLSVNETDSSPGQNFADANMPSDDTQPAQPGRDSTAAGGKPGTLGNNPPQQNRPFTPLGDSVGPGGNAQRPKS